MEALYEWGVIAIWGFYKSGIFIYNSIFFDVTNVVEDMDISKIAKTLVKSVSSGEVGVIPCTSVIFSRKAKDQHFI